MATVADGRVRLWDLRTGEQIGSAFRADSQYGATASPNLRRIVTGEDGHVVVWDAELEHWPETACAAAGRNLTVAEWARYGPQGDARATCPQSPRPTV